MAYSATLLGFQERFHLACAVALLGFGCEKTPEPLWVVPPDSPEMEAPRVRQRDGCHEEASLRAAAPRSSDPAAAYALAMERAVRQPTAPVPRLEAGRAALAQGRRAEARRLLGDALSLHAVCPMASSHRLQALRLIVPLEREVGTPTRAALFARELAEAEERAGASSADRDPE